MTPSNEHSAATPAGGDLQACEQYREMLAGYVDGELHGDELLEFESHLAECTECQREVAVFHSLKGELQAMGLKSPEVPGGSVWNDVNKHVARPAGWIFLIIGILMYVVYAVYTFIQSTGNLFEKLATGFLVIGFVVLLATVAYERIVSYKTDPYKGIEK